MVASPVGSEARINTYTQRLERFSTIAANAHGNYVVVWTSDTTASSSPDSRASGVYSQLFQADGTPLGDEFQVKAQNLSTVESVAMDDEGNFVVTWITYNSGGNAFDIYGRRFRADGTPDGEEFQINTITDQAQLNADIAMNDDGNFVVTWLSRNGARSGIFARRYRADGTPLDDEEFQINAVSRVTEAKPSIAMDDDGNFVVTWNGITQNSGHDIYVRRFNANGDPLRFPSGDDTEVRVNTVEENPQDNADVAMTPDGGFIVTWQEYAETSTGNSQRDNDSFGIYAQRYTANGTKEAPEFRVNSTTNGAQYVPKVAVDSQGNAVITWISKGQDGDQGGIYARYFQQDTGQWGNEIQVNTRTEGDQIDPAIAMTGIGDFVISWHSADNEITSEIRDADIYARRFSTPNRPIIGTPFRDELTGDAGDDSIRGLAGNDTLRGLGGSDGLSGGDGDDTLEGGDGQDLLDGGDGDDNLEGGNGPDTLVGGDGDDFLRGGNDNDFFLGGNGRDSLHGDDGDDVMDGGNGSDILNGGAGNDNIDAGAGADSLDGGAGDDVMKAGAGRDFLRGRAGSDRMEGGAGNDTYVVEDVGDTVIEGNYGTLAGHTDLVYSALPTYTLPAHVENLSLGGDDDGVVITGLNGIGNSGNNRLEGNSKSNRLEGREGRDFLYGRAGSDRLYGNDGNDVLEGDVGNDRLYGNDGIDILYGQAGADILHGDDGSDQLSGGEDRDVLKGGAAHDSLHGGAGGDRLYGGTHNDHLHGDAGNDKLKGESGDDILIGSVVGVGRENPNSDIDKLIGGAGADYFVLGYSDQTSYKDTRKRHGTGSYARIWDFRSGEDVIYLGEGDYVLKKSPIRRVKGTGIFLEKEVNGSTTRDLIGVIRGIHFRKLDLNDDSQFVIGSDLLPTTANFDHFG